MARRERDRLQAKIAAIDKEIERVKALAETCRRKALRAQVKTIEFSDRRERYADRCLVLQEELRKPGRRKVIATLPPDVLTCLRAARDLRDAPLFQPDSNWRFTAAALVIADTARKILEILDTEGSYDNEA